MQLDGLDTPALLIDLDRVEANLQRVASYAAEHNLRLRPHTKTHKSPAFGRMQLATGAAGLTVAKVSEAEVMVRANPPDLLIAYPVLGERKLARLVEVARQVPLTVSLDSLTAAAPLAAAARAGGVEIGVLAEFDVGQGRVGVNPGDELRTLIEGIRKLDGLRWMGITFYPGHIKTVQDAQADEVMESLANTVRDTVQDLERNGLYPAVVSGGSTPTLFRSHEIPYLNEVRPGTYIFHDRNTVQQGVATWDDCAASVLTTVISTARPDQMILDGGSKTFFSDGLALHNDGCFGRLIPAPEARFFKMNEEHGYVALEKAADRFTVGDRVRVIPNHVCVCVNLHERVYGIRGDRVESVFEVEARGKLQ